MGTFVEGDMAMPFVRKERARRVEKNDGGGESSHGFGRYGTYRLHGQGMRLWVWTITNVTVLVTVGVTEAAAPVTLTWNAPPDCPRREAVLSDVQRILGGPTNRVVLAQADVTEIGPEHWSVHLVTSVDGTPGDRTIDANSCASLAAATALILAWTVDPSKGVAPTSPPEQGVGAPAPAVAPTPAPEERTTVRDRPGASGSFGAAVAVGAAADSATLPSPAVAGEITIAGLLGPVRVEVSGADWVTQHATQAVRNESEGMTIHLFDVAAHACFRWRPRAELEVSPCLGAAIFFATGDGFAPGTPAQFQPQHFSRVDWSAMQGDVLAVWRIYGPVALRASLGVGIPLAPPQFRVDLSNPSGEVPLHTPAPSARAALGVEARFP
jgi:hypothetical protein